MTYIYGLRCPLTDTIRYVGKSDDPEKRLHGHLAGAACHAYDHHTARWLRKLMRVGLAPQVVILHHVQRGERWQDAERRIIGAMKMQEVEMIALTSQRYAGKVIEAGDEFKARECDAETLSFIKRARRKHIVAEKPAARVKRGYKRRDLTGSQINSK